MKQIIFVVAVGKKQWLVKTTEKGYFYKPAEMKSWERLTEDRFLCAVEQATGLRVQYGTEVVAEYKLVPVKANKKAAV